MVLPGSLGRAAMQSEPVSLYLDLKAGEKPDLEIVARASIAFVAAVKEAAYILDPSIEVALDLASSTEGSLSLNTIIRNLGKASKPTGISLKAIAFVVLGWFANDIRQYGVGKFLDAYLFNDTHAELSEADVERIAKAVKLAMEGKVAKGHVQRVYQELERDTAIKGVGATLAPERRPPNIVPRAEFTERAGIAEVVETSSPKSRTKKTPERLTLISPVLLPRENRRWKFYSPAANLEFGAAMKDERFLASLLAGRRRIPMRAGIQMDVILETHEEKQGEVWAVKDRAIEKVIRVRRAPKTADLFSTAKKNDEDDE
jgi:hypothetical protein